MCVSAYALFVGGPVWWVMHAAVACLKKLYVGAGMRQPPHLWLHLQLVQLAATLSPT